MNINDLHKITADLISKGNGSDEVSIDYNTFIEGDNGENICSVEDAQFMEIECLDPDEDSTSPEEHLVLKGHCV